MSTDKELSGRVALVTGAGRNIGRAMAKSLAAGGAAVVVNVRSNRPEAEQVVAEIERDGGKAIAAVADVGDEKAVFAMVADAAKQLGRIDYLINNAALRGERTFEEMSFTEWRTVLGVMLDGAFHCAKALGMAKGRCRRYRLVVLERPHQSARRVARREPARCEHRRAQTRSLHA